MMIVAALLLLGADPACSRALSAAPELACAQATRGVALAETPDEARRLADLAQAAETRFAQRFQRQPAAYVVIATPPTVNRTALVAAGFEHVLPWPAPRVFDEAAHKSLEQGVRRFAATQNMTAAQTEEVVARALAQVPDAEAQRALDAGMVPHELGHLWFTAAFWPQQAAPDDAAPRHYGGPGPDWLDEIAAVVLEDDATAALRRGQFQALMRGEMVPAIGPVDARAVLLDLPGFLEREHPALARAVAALPEITRSEGVGVTFTPAGAGPDSVAQERLFYVQARAFADFLIQQSGREDILSAVAEGLASGKSLADWLGEDGQANGLPASLGELDANWRRFATRGDDAA